MLNSILTAIQNAEIFAVVYLFGWEMRWRGREDVNW